MSAQSELAATVQALILGAKGILAADESGSTIARRLESIGVGSQPWPLSFSCGRALLEPVLHAWGGQATNIRSAQNALLKRARLNSAARQGICSAAMEQAD